MDPFCLSTRDGIAGGATQAIVGGIERAVRQFRQRFGADTVVFVTGGSGAEIASMLEFEARLEPALVIHGLRVIVEGT